MTTPKFNRPPTAVSTFLALSSAELDDGDFIESAHHVEQMSMCTFPAPTVYLDEGSSHEDTWPAPFTWPDVALLVRPGTDLTQATEQARALLTLLEHHGAHLLASVEPHARFYEAQRAKHQDGAGLAWLEGEARAHAKAGACWLHEGEAPAPRRHVFPRELQGEELHDEPCCLELEEVHCMS